MKKPQGSPRKYFCTVTTCDQPATRWVRITKDAWAARCVVHAKEGRYKP